MDDHIHRVVLRPDHGLSGLHGSPVDLFSFASGSPADARALMDQGVFPWSTDPDVRLRFFRPLSSLTHWVDHRLWPQSPVAAHLHSLAWFAAAIAAAWFALRRVVADRRLALLALALFALDDARGPTVSWIANRNALVALTFGLLALGLHVRGRTATPTRQGRVALAAGCLGLALCSGEAAVATCAFLFAWATCFEPGPLWRRWATLWPHVAVGAAWALLYATLGFGAHGSGVYLSPADGVLPFASGLLTNAFVLAVGQFAPLLWSDFWVMMPPEGKVLYATLGGAWLLGFAALLVRPVRSSAAARFALLATLLALVPVSATFAADRLLSFVGLSGALLVAVAISSAWGLPAGEPPGPVAAPRRRARAAGWLLVGAHLGLALLLAPVRARTMVTVEGALHRAESTIPAGPGIATRTVIAVNPAFDPLFVYVPIIRESLGIERPHRLRGLVNGYTGVSVSRPSDRSLVVSPGGGLMASPAEMMLRNPVTRPFAIGDRVELDGMAVTVLALTPDGRPATMRFDFDAPLDDPRFVWLAWDQTRYVPFVPPAIGAEVELPPQSIALALFGRPDEVAAPAPPLP
jgi:hypothetical protein